MPSHEELLEKHKRKIKELATGEGTVPKKIRRGAKTRPWQDNLAKYDEQEGFENLGNKDVGIKEVSGDDVGQITTDAIPSSTQPTVSTASESGSATSAQVVSKMKIPKFSKPTELESLQRNIRRFSAEHSMYYFLLLQVADENLMVSAGQKALADLFCLPERSLKRTIKLMLGNKMLRIEKEHDRSNKAPRMYKLLI